MSDAAKKIEIEGIFACHIPQSVENMIAGNIGENGPAPDVHMSTNSHATNAAAKQGTPHAA